jgi:hypothetical protein
MKQRSRRRLPWEKDPADREANYRRPVAQSEKVRLTIKVVAVVAGFLFIMGATRDRTDVGAEFAIGVGVPLVIAGVIDVLWTMRGQLEHVFLESKSMQLAAHSAMALVGMAMITAGLIAKGA